MLSRSDQNAFKRSYLILVYPVNTVKVVLTLMKASQQ